MKSKKIIVKGRVQGIGYRYFVRDEAGKIGIKGWVKNLSNGNVLILAQGEKTDVDDFIERVKVGNVYARIDEIEIRDAGEEDLIDFQIKY
ncbi:MAG: acylphosphatase [bacterium]